MTSARPTPVGGARGLGSRLAPERTGTRRRPSGEPPPLPRHVRASGVWWLVSALALIGLSVAMFSGHWRRPAVAVTVADDTVVRALGGVDVPGFVGAMRAVAVLGSPPLLTAALWLVLLSLLALRRLRHLVVFLLAWQAAAQLFLAVSPAARRPRPFGVPLRADWQGWALPSLSVAVLSAAAVAVLYTLVPEGRARNVGKWIGAAVVALVALARMTLGLDTPTDVAVAAAIGVAVLLVAFRVLTPSEAFPVTYRRGRTAHLDVGGERGRAIRRALREQLGLVVTDLRPFGLAGSAGSTPLRITVGGEVEGAAEGYLFGKLYAENHLRSDRWYKLGRELLYGRLEDEKPFHTVRRLVQQEDYALRLFRDSALPTPAPIGVAELTPEREYLLVTEFFDGAVELGEAEVNEVVVDAGLAIVRRLWDAGLAHRDVKPSNLLVRGDEVFLIDVAFAELRPTPWRQAVDLANMMLCLALRADAEQVYRRALAQFTVEDVAEAFAAARGLALPSQLRRALRAQGRDLHGEFVALLPEPPRPVRIQRWNARRFALWAGVLLAVGLVVQERSVFNLRSSDLATLRTGAVGCADMSAMWLAAQALPSATRLPCVRPLPAGWRIDDVQVQRGRARYRFGHDRAGRTVLTATLLRSCPGGAAPSGTAAAPPGGRSRVVPLRPGVDGGWREVFPGGCLTVRLHSATRDTAVAAEVTAGSRSILGFVDRSALRLALDRRSDGRLRLDP